MRTAGIAAALILAAGSLAATRSAPDKWAGLIGADHDAVEKALGQPEFDYIGFVEPEERPLLHVGKSLPPASEGSKAEGMRVMQYPGPEGLEPQVVFDKDGKVAWAVAPPAADEKNARAIEKKYGKAASIGPAESMRADMLRTFELLSYPSRGRIFVHRQGEEAILARVILQEKKP